MIDGHRVIRPQRRVIGLDHRMQTKPLADLWQDWHAKLAAAVGDHEVHRFGSRFFGRTHEVPFVFAVFGIHNNNDPSGADRLNGLFNSGKVMVQLSFRRS